MLALALVTIVVGWQAFSTLSRSVHEAARQALVASLEMRREQIEATLAERRADALIFASRSSVLAMGDLAAAPDPLARLTTEQTIADRMALSHYDAIVLLDSTMRWLAGTRDALQHPVELLAVQAALETRQLQLVDIHPDTGNRVTYGIAAPVIRRDAPGSRPIGVAYLEISAVGPTRSLISPWPSSYHSLELSLLRRKGETADVMSIGGDRANPVWNFTTHSLTDRQNVITTALLGPNGSLHEAVDDHGTEVIAVSAAVSETAWVLLAQISRAEIEAPVTRLGWTIASLVCTLLLAVALVGALTWREGQSRQKLRAAVLAQRYAAAIAGMQDGFLRIDAAGRIVDANEAVSGMTGYSRAELLEMEFTDLETAGHASIQPELPRRTGASNSRRFQTKWATRFGHSIDVDESATFVAEGTTGHTYIIGRDITLALTEQRRVARLNRLQGLVNHVYQTIQRINDPQAILKEICTDFVIGRNVVLVWAGWVDREAGRVVPIAAAGAAKDYVLDLEITLDPALPTSQGPSGRCVREGQMIVPPAMQSDPSTSPWHAEAVRWALGSSVSLPILSRGQTVALLALYSGETDRFTDDELNLFREMSETIAVAIEAADGRRTAEQLDRLHAESETRLRAILQASPLPVLVVSEAAIGQIRSLNTAFERLFGYGIGDFPTMARWLDEACSNPAERTALREQGPAVIAAARKTGSPSKLPEVTLRSRTGENCTVQGHVSVSGDDVIVAWSDLTDIRQQESALRRREDIYSAIVEQAGDAIALVRADDGSFIEFNTAAHASLGYSRAEFAAMRARDIAPAIMMNSETDRQVEALPIGTGLVFETAVRRRDGTLRDARVSVRKIQIEGRLYNAAIWTDITEEREKVRALATESEKHRVLFESAPTGILVMVDDVGIIDTNTQLLVMLRATRDEVVGTHAADWVADPALGARWLTEHHWRRHLGRGTAQLRRKDGTLMDVEMNWSRAVIGGQTVYYANLIDITGRLRDEQHLRRTERLSVIGQLTGGIAHDFNNLLTVISLNLEIAVAGLDDTDPSKAMLTSALNAAYRGGELNSQLLSFARRQSLRPVQTDLDSFLAPLHAMATRAVGERYTIEYIREGVLRPCLVDQAKLESAVLNLVINARDAMPDGGKIHIETTLLHVGPATPDVPPGTPAGDYVMIAVRDHGTGMTPDVRDRAFEPFFTTKGTGKGTGLGLSTVMGFVTQSGGYVTIDTAVAHGTLVKIHLPAESTSESGQAEADLSDWTPGPVRTLIVEDQDDVRDAAIQMCRQVGLDIIAAVNSAEAALPVLRGDPDIALLFTDVVMPGAMTGLELGEIALLMRPNLRVIYASGRSEHGVTLDAYGRAEFLPKPYRREQLVAALRALLAGDRTRNRIAP